MPNRFGPHRHVLREGPRASRGNVARRTVQPDGRQADLQKISRAEFMARLGRLLGTGKPWTVYFSYRTMPRIVGSWSNSITALVSSR